MSDRADARAEVDAVKSAAAQIRKDIEATEDRVVDALAARVARLFTEASELNALAAVLLEMRKRGQ